MALILRGRHIGRLSVKIINENPNFNISTGEMFVLKPRGANGTHKLAELISSSSVKNHLQYMETWPTTQSLGSQIGRLSTLTF